MWSWRSKGSKIFGWWLASLLLMTTTLFAQGEGEKEPDHLGATTRIAVTLSGIASYNDFLEIRTALAKTEGVDRVILETEAPGLITMTVRYAGEARGLIESLSTFFPQKYKITEKNLKAGSELNITKFY